MALTMASSSNLSATDEMDQLVALQRSGILSMSEFLRMSREINMTKADRLDEARGNIHDDVPADDESTKSTSGSEMLVDENGDLFAAAEATMDEVDGVGEGGNAGVEEGGNAAAEGGAVGKGSGVGKGGGLVGEDARACAGSPGTTAKAITTAATSTTASVEVPCEPACPEEHRPSVPTTAMPDGAVGAEGCECDASAEEKVAAAQAIEAAAAEVVAARRAHQEAEVEAATTAEHATAAAHIAMELQELAAKAKAAVKGDGNVDEPPMGRVPADGQPLESGRLGVLSMRAVELADARYGFSGSYNIYVSVAFPKIGRSFDVTGWGTAQKQLTWTAPSASRQECQVAADQEARRIGWQLLLPHLPREKQTRSRKRPESSGERRTSARSHSTEPSTSSDGRQTNGGKTEGSGRASKMARGCGLGYGTPSAISSLFQPAVEAAPSVQLAMLAKAREEVRTLRLQLAQTRCALEASEEVSADLRRDLARLRQWAVSEAASDLETLPSPHKLPQILGTGYSPTERTRTLWNHFHRAFDAVTSITRGDLRKTAELFTYAAERLRLTGSVNEKEAAIRSAIVESLRDFFTAARERTGDGRPPRKLAQCVQVILAAVARAPELGGVSMAAVANELALGPQGVSKLNARTDAADAFVFSLAYDGLFEDRSKVRSDAYSQEQIDWIVSECWLSDEFTRESEQKKHEVCPPQYGQHGSDPSSYGSALPNMAVTLPSRLRSRSRSRWPSAWPHRCTIRNRGRRTVSTTGCDGLSTLSASSMCAAKRRLQQRRCRRVGKTLPRRSGRSPSTGPFG